jgi:hypothetical protein
MTEQLPLFESAPPPPQLPPLPSIVRYYDDFDRVDRRLGSLEEDLWQIHLNGRIVRWKFDRVANLPCSTSSKLSKSRTGPS